MPALGKATDGGYVLKLKPETQSAIPPTTANAQIATHEASATATNTCGDIAALSKVETIRHGVPISTRRASEHSHQARNHNAPRQNRAQSCIALEERRRKLRLACSPSPNKRTIDPLTGSTTLAARQADQVSGGISVLSPRRAGEFSFSRQSRRAL